MQISYFYWRKLAAYANGEYIINNNQNNPKDCFEVDFMEASYKRQRKSCASFDKKYYDSSRTKK